MGPEWGRNGAAGKELYDHVTDPGEMKNLASPTYQNRDKYQTTMDQLAKMLQKRIAHAESKPGKLIQNLSRQFLFDPFA